jgi:hypothetical protein
MSGVRKLQSTWVGAACCLAILGCSERSPTAAVPTDSAPAAPAVEEQASNDVSSEQAAPASVQSAAEPRWDIVEKTDEMAGTVTRFAVYRAILDATTADVEMTCPEQGADGALLQVTTYDGLLATAFDEVLGHPSATARIDTGSGEIRTVALMQSDKYANVYFYVNRGGVQMKNVLARDIPLLRDAPIGASSLEVSGDTANFKLELELTNGTKRVLRGDAALAQYLAPCTAEAVSQRQQQKEEEQRQLQEAAKQQQKEELDQWLREQQEASAEPAPTAEPGEAAATPPSS